jgi:hypothetical protein
MSVSPIRLAAALETLQEAGWRLVAPASERLRLLRPSEVAELLGCGEVKARAIIRSLPNSVRLPGDDLRARPADLEAWQAAHRIPSIEPAPSDLTEP